MTDVLVETTIPTSHTTRVTVGWAATDANAHMRSTAYLDAINDCRMHFFHTHGWPLERFHATRIGPTILDEYIQYRHELLLGDTALIDLTVAEQRPDGTRCRLRNIVRRERDDTIAATVTSTVAWIDLDHRRLVPAPEELRTIIATLTPSEGPDRAGYESQ